MKTPQQHFADWESHVFGYGYGSGEEHVLQALKAFLAAVPSEGTYDYRKLEQVCSPTVAWLLINTLAHANVIEYGTSPRFGWLMDNGKALRTFVCGTPMDELVEMTAGRSEEDIPCYPDVCNCDTGDCRVSNPFWPKSAIVTIKSDA